MGKAGFFTEETLTFWRGLAADNSKAYFDAHRKDYERHLKAPYQALAAALVAGLTADQPEYGGDPKRATYRINRDTRFSKDKTPYKTELGITVGRAEKHDHAFPGYTCRVGVAGVAVAGGLYAPTTSVRDHVRRYIAAHRDAFHAAADAPEFVQVYGGVIGDAHKRPLPDLKEIAAAEPVVRNTQWIFWGASRIPTCCWRRISTSSSSTTGRSPGRSWSS
ncbi:MAG: TIGR02453 family protein [Acidimicrobiales bacterium]